MSKVDEFMSAMMEKYGPVPESFTFGDGIDWSSPLAETMLYVELPFWLMVSAGPVEVDWSGTSFTVHVCPLWNEVFVDEVTDSRRSVLHQGPWHPTYEPPDDIAAELARQDAVWMRRVCKTVVRVSTHSHADAFRPRDEREPPRARLEQQAYWASLCEAHIPVINELIRRYRLVTYDYFAYEVSAWDVPVWYLGHAGTGYTTVLLPYKSWDYKPTTIEEGDGAGDPLKVRPFEWATLVDLSSASSADATPGEFDLLDARSMLERGDYTGAVRRAVTAIEAVLEWALVEELRKKYSLDEAERRVANTNNDFPGRLRQWRKLANPPINQLEFDEFETTRELRHQIVHRGRRLVHSDRARAQRAVDAGRWLYNKIECKPDRAQLRDYGVLKSVGRVAVAPRFPAVLGPTGITLGPITHPDLAPGGPDET